MMTQKTVLDEISNIQFGFGNRHEPIPENLNFDWEQNQPKWKQVHGINFTEVTKPRQNCGEVDALFTSQKKLSNCSRYG